MRAFIAVAAVIIAGCTTGSAAPDDTVTTAALPAPDVTVTTAGLPATAEPVASSAPGPPTSVPTGTGTDTPTESPGRRPEGFTAVAAEVTLADGSTCQLCLWLADSADERSRGLMGVTDLGGADGMAFSYDAASTGAFWMRGTPMPLSIAFFGADGVWVSTSDMTPCLDGPPEACRRYPPGGPFTTAVEVPLGRFDELGIGAGSRLELVRPVDACLR